MNLEFYRIIGGILSEGIDKSYKAGLASVVKLNKKEILRLKDDSEPELFNINYTGTDKELLEYFKTEAFEVAGVSSIELEDKLKKLAANIIEGKHPLSKGERDIKELWSAEAQNLISDYVPVKDMPPPSYLNTNLQTAMNAAYHGSRYNRLQDPSIKGLYPAYQYKTRKDARVRDEHRALDDKIFYADDEIWKSIIPPNGWNCRCYYNPLNQDEVNSDKSIIHPITTEEDRVNIIREARIAKNFNKNPAIHKSIYGKWLDDKGKALGIYELMKQSYKDKLLPKNYFKEWAGEDLIKLIEKHSIPFIDEKASKENWDKKFPNNICNTIIGEARFIDVFIKELDRYGTQQEKLNAKKDGRENLFGLIKPTLENPIFIIKDKYSGLIFIKSFKKDSGSIIFSAVAYDKGDILDIISLHERNRIDSLLEKFKEGEVFYFFASTSENPGKFKRDTSHTMPVAFELNTNIIEKIKSFNEIWSYTYFENGVNNLKTVYINYMPDGIKIIKKMNNEIKKPIFKDYSELDNYRVGVPL